MSLGGKLRELRKKRGLSLREFGEKFNLAKSSLSEYENDKIKPPQETLVKFANFFDVSTDYLLGRVDDPEVNLLTLNDELKSLGVEQAGILKQFSESGLDEQELQELIEFVKKIKKQP